MKIEVQAEMCRAGVVTRRFAIKHGMSGEEIDRWVRAGEWVAVWRGVYTTGEIWAGLDEYVGRPLWRSRAASAYMLSPHVMSHDSAALEHGLSVLDAAKQPVHVTRFGVVGSRSRHGVKHHLAPHEPWQILILPDGRGALDVARTCVDVTRDRGLLAGLVTTDSAMSSGLPREALVEAASAMVSWRHVTLVREVNERADPGADSVGETLTRDLLEELGFRSETHFGITDGRRTAWCDLRVGRQVLEFDGKVKYGRDVDGDPPEERLWKEKQREDFVRGFRLGMSRVVWRELHGERRRELKRRLAREIAATDALWGRDISDLAPFRPPGPRPRRQPASPAPAPALQRARRRRPGVIEGYCTSRSPSA